MKIYVVSLLCLLLPVDLSMGDAFLQTGTTEVARETARLARVWPIGLRVSTLNRRLVLVTEDSSHGTDPLYFYRSFKIKAQVALAPLMSRVALIDGGEDLRAKSVTRSLVAAVQVEVTVLTNVVTDPTGRAVATNFVFVSTRVLRGISGAVPVIPDVSLAVNEVDSTQDKLVLSKSGNISTLLGPLSGAANWTLDLGGHRRNSTGETRVTSSLSPFSDQVVLSMGDVVCEYKKLDSGVRLGLRYGARLGLWGDSSVVRASGPEYARTCATIKSLTLCLASYLAIPITAISATDEVTPLARQEIEVAFAQATVDQRRASIEKFKLLLQENGLPIPPLPDPTSSTGASAYRTCLERSLPRCNPFDPAPGCRVRSGLIRLVFEFFPATKWHEDLKPVVARLLLRAPGVTRVTEDPAAPEIGFLVQAPPGQRDAIRNWIVATLREVTGADVDTQVPSGEKRTLYIQHR